MNKNQQEHIFYLEEKLREAEAELARREDPTMDLVHANIDSIRNVLQQGLVKAKRFILAGQDGLAVETIEAALSFHPMHAESWPGWPEERKTGAALEEDDGRERHSP